MASVHISPETEFVTRASPSPGQISLHSPARTFAASGACFSALARSASAAAVASPTCFRIVAGSASRAESRGSAAADSRENAAKAAMIATSHDFLMPTFYHLPPIRATPKN